MESTDPHRPSLPVVITRRATLAGGMGLMAWILNAFAGFFPALAAITFELAAHLAVALGSLFMSISAWFQRSSDEVHERVLWAIAAVTGLGILVYGLVAGWFVLHPVLKFLVVALAILGFAVYLQKRRYP